MLMQRSIFARPWLAPEYPVVLDGISIALLTWMGPPSGETNRTRAVHKVNHQWPPVLPADATRSDAAEVFVGTFKSHPEIYEHYRANLMAEAAAPPERQKAIIQQYVAQAAGVPLAGGGVCLYPAIMPRDTFSEVPGPVVPGDLVAVQLRGSLTTLIKGYAGEDEDGRQLFYMSNPLMLVSVAPDDLLYAGKLAVTVPPDRMKVRDLVERDAGLKDGALPPAQRSRLDAWAMSMQSILDFVGSFPVAADRA